MAVKNLYVNDYLFHSLVHDYRESIITLDSILTDGGIIPPSIKKINKRYGCNKSDETCLSMNNNVAGVRNINLYVSCFELYLSRLVTIMIDKKFSKDFKVFKPKLVSTCDIILNPDLVDGGDCTNLYDEYRTKEIISTDYFRGISIPYDALVEDPITFFTFLVKEAMIEFYNFGLDENLQRTIKMEQGGLRAKEDRKRMVNQYIESIKEIFSSHGMDMPIYSYSEDKTFKRKA